MNDTAANATVLDDGQRAAVEALRDGTGAARGRVLLDHSTGMGKTVTSVAAIADFLAGGPPDRRAIVLVPLSVQVHWKDHVRRMIPDRAARSRVSVETHRAWTNAVRRAASAALARPVAAGGRGRALGARERLPPTTTDVASPALVRALEAATGRRTMLVVDEAHEFRTRVRVDRSKKRRRPGDDDENEDDEGTPERHNGLMADVLMAAAARAGRLLLATATPVFDAPDNLFNLACMLDARDSVACERLVARDGPRGQLGRPCSGGASAADCARNLLQGPVACSVSSRRRPGASDVAWPDDDGRGSAALIAGDPGGAPFPDLRVSVVRVPMTPSFLAAYVKIENCTQYYDQDARRLVRPKVFHNGTRRAANAQHHVDEATETARMADLDEERVDDNAKVAWLVRAVRTWAPAGRRAVVFSSFRAAGVERVARRIEREAGVSAGGGVLRIHGDTTPEERQAAVDAFNDRSGPARVLLITRAGAQGIDLRGAERVVIMEPYWNMSLIEQVVGRAVRRNSHADMPPDRRKVRAYILVHTRPGALGTRDEEMVRMALEKREAMVALRAVAAENAIEHASCRGERLASRRRLHARHVPWVPGSGDAVAAAGGGRAAPPLQPGLVALGARRGLGAAAPAASRSAGGGAPKLSAGGSVRVRLGAHAARDYGAASGTDASARRPSGFGPR